MKVKKAVILTAGYSTRFLPVCKNIPKPMLPLLEVPIIHEQVKECIDGGIESVIIVTSFGNGPVEDYFDGRPDLDEYLSRTGKEERNKRFDEVFGKVNVTCVRQNKSLPYGSGSALLAAKPWLDDGEPFALMYGDDLVLAKDSAIGQMKNFFEKEYETNPNIGGVMAADMVDESVVDKYGVLKFKEGSNTLVERVIEKPTAQEAPSLLASYGRFIVSYDIFKYLDPKNTPKGELFFSEALDILCSVKDIYYSEIEGKWLTTGDPLNYLKAILRYAMQRDEYRDKLKEYIQTLV